MIPLHYTNIFATILLGKNKIKIKAEGVVVKGDIEPSKIGNSEKKRVLSHLYKHESNPKSKIHNFNLKNVIIDKVEIIRFMGFGI